MRTEPLRTQNRVHRTLDIVRRVSGALCGLSTKDVMRRLGRSKATVVRWRAGESEPTASDLIKLMRDFDEVYEAVLEMSGRASVALTDEQRQAAKQALQLLLGDG